MSQVGSHYESGGVIMSQVGSHYESGWVTL